MTVPDLIRRWQYGWGLAKGLAPAETLTGSHKNAVALKVTLDLPGRYQELLPLDTEHARYFAGVAARAAKPTWVSVIGADPKDVLADFKAAGLDRIAEADSLMSIALAEHPVHDAPEGYTVEVAVTDPVSHKRTLDERSSWDGSDVNAPAAGEVDEAASQDSVIRVRVADANGELAARGLMGVHGTDAIAHGIMTEPAHRRRGLGSVVMSALSRKAIELGADTGLLVAVPEGRYLYNKIGWSERADFVSGSPPEWA
ncbi:GNAT family N-acetyltransferase [Stackebrandtia nassauensis]|uniref:GCN5-related N-acetyltransferase n=1 Tax=Stackebrandtia nassauensis (strain DSM 44728 / CIP 108903 / NRRL B-16338 / NBRC 102104 / LLR-40K-21) TaxID=446470 RepID=D3QBY6_STANL|nr:GNAT family N-acetyltransferase [Stackebrandtia nassauensis]ADD44875.1 GCN5-related N-acetyltransferase [Stackebrandtia nassauensis DSM 44728]